MMDDHHECIPIMKGWGHKRTRGAGLLFTRRDTWSRVFFVLNMGTLSYYDNEEENLEFPYGSNLNVRW